MLFHWLSLHLATCTLETNVRNGTDLQLPKLSNSNFPDSSNKDQGVAQTYLQQTEMFPTISGLANGSSSSSTSRNELHPSERFEFSNKDEMAELAVGLNTGKKKTITTTKKNNNTKWALNPGVLQEIAIM